MEEINNENNATKGFIDKDGFMCEKLFKDGKFFNRLIHMEVAKTHVPNPENRTQIRFIDGNKLNCSPDNLEWF